MATLTYTFKELYTKVSRFLGTGTTPTGQALLDAQDIVNRAYRRFVYPVVLVGQNPRLHQWSFLQKTSKFTVTAGVSTYAMPLDFGDILTPFTYVEQDRSLVTQLKSISESMMLQYFSFHENQGEPLYYCIRERPYTVSTEQTHELLIYPFPNGDYTYAYSYNVNPPRLANDGDLPIGGAECAETIMQMCLSAAELEQDEVSGVQETKAKELLLMAVQADKERTAPSTVGMNTDQSVSDWIRFPGKFHTGDPLLNKISAFGQIIG